MPPKGFSRAARLAELAKGQMVVADVRGERVLLCNIVGDVFAVSEVCPHAGGPLGDGYLTDRQVECPWHASVFDVTTGKLIDGPASEDLKVYEVLVEGDVIYVGQEKG